MFHTTGDHNAFARPNTYFLIPKGQNLIISTAADKKSRYESLIPQIEGLTMGEPDLIANLSNIAAALRYGMGFFWVGFYLVKERYQFQRREEKEAESFLS